MASMPPMVRLALLDLSEMSDAEFSKLETSVAAVDHYQSDQHLHDSFSSVIQDEEKSQRLGSFVVAFARTPRSDDPSPERLVRNLLKGDSLDLDQEGQDVLTDRFVRLVTTPQITNAAEANRKERAGAHHLHTISIDSGFKIAKSVDELEHTLVLQHELTVRYGNPFGDESESVTIVVPVNALKDMRDEIDNAIEATSSLPDKLRELKVRVWADPLPDNEGEA